MTEDETKKHEPYLPPETRKMFVQMRETLAHSGNTNPVLDSTPTETVVVEETVAYGLPFGADSGTPEPEPTLPAPTRQVPPTPPTAGDGTEPAAARPEPAKRPVQVGLLVWALILMLVGLLMIASILTVSGGLHGVLVGGLVVTGIVFLVLAFTTGDQRPQVTGSR